jgi:hypothetical protein
MFDKMKTLTDKEYRSLELVSYSSLSKLAVSPQAYKADQESERKESPEMVLGTVVDMLLTDKKRFDEEVYVMTASKPGSEMMLRYCEVLADTGDSSIAYLNSGFKLKADAVANKFDKEGRDYYDALIAAKGKTIISAEGMFTANQLVAQLTSNPFTKGYFINDSEDIELLFQASMVWDVQFVPIESGQGNVKLMRVKSMIDIVHVDHKKGIITPIDLKTGGEGFMKSYWRYKRYLQASMYTDALVHVGWDNDRMNHYAVAPLKFIYADTNLIYAPMIYTSTPVDIEIGRNGLNYLAPVAGLAKSFNDGEIAQIDTIGFGPSDLRKTKGYLQLIAELDWHQRNDMWDYTYEDYLNGGEKQIDAFSVKL